MRSDETEDGAAWREGQDSTCRYQEGVLASNPDAVALSVGDDEEGSVLREVGRCLQEIDAGLENGATATPDPDTYSDVERFHPPVVMCLCVTEDHAHGGQVTGDGVRAATGSGD